MRRITALVFVVGWLLGIATGLVGMAVTGGWYEHRLEPVIFDRLPRRVNNEGWQLVWQQPIEDHYYLRRPRFRIP